MGGIEIEVITKLVVEPKLQNINFAHELNF